MLKRNDNVIILKTNQKGKILRINEKKDNIYYTIELENSTKVLLPEDDITIANDNTMKNTYTNSVKLKYNLASESSDDEIMIRHQTVLEAIENVDRFLNDSIAHRNKRVRIIHGRHGGILRKAVHEYLSTLPYVESFHIADTNEGSIGATIVYLK